MALTEHPIGLARVLKELAVFVRDPNAQAARRRGRDLQRRLRSRSRRRAAVQGSRPNKGRRRKGRPHEARCVGPRWANYWSILLKGNGSKTGLCHDRVPKAKVLLISLRTNYVLEDRVLMIGQTLTKNLL